MTGQVAFERLADRAFLKMRSWRAKGGPLVSVGVIESDEASENMLCSAYSRVWAYTPYRRCATMTIV